MNDKSGKRRSDSQSGKKHRPPRFKGGPDDITVDSLIVDVSELDVVYHHVDELGEAEDHITFRQAERDESEMDMTPMVDVTFLLLIFFMVTAAFSLQRSIPVPTPRPDLPSSNAEQREMDADTVTVHVDENNTFRVVTTDWDQEAPSKHELLIKLREARSGNSRGQRPSKLLVMANMDAMHAAVVAAMDAGSQVEMEQIQLQMVEENE
jgi:biopolymer transport protein ExbD